MGLLAPFEKHYVLTILVVVRPIVEFSGVFTFFKVPECLLLEKFNLK